MTPTREEVIRVARECGLGTSLLPFEEIGDKGGIWLDGDFNYLDLIERLASHFYEAGAAAAREPLVEALKGLLDDTQHAAHMNCDEGPCPVRDAREALAKATGEKT